MKLHNILKNIFKYEKYSVIAMNFCNDEHKHI